MEPAFNDTWLHNNADKKLVRKARRTKVTMEAEETRRLAEIVVELTQELDKHAKRKTGPANVDLLRLTEPKPRRKGSK
jgi:histone H3/H4